MLLWRQAAVSRTGHSRAVVAAAVVVAYMFQMISSDRFRVRCWRVQVCTALLVKVMQLVRQSSSSSLIRSQVLQMLAAILALVCS